MKIAGITLPGLAALAVSVTLLWGCLIAERILEQRAVREQARALHEIELLRHRRSAEPVADPLPRFPNPRPRTVG
ncbi:MAG: hypothetical protein LAP40_17775 [Acidobacteriia bacterium]|nr:hypothetical protein [Terriglobia bacterium]